MPVWARLDPQPMMGQASRETTRPKGATHIQIVARRKVIPTQSSDLKLRMSCSQVQKQEIGTFIRHSSFVMRHASRPCRSAKSNASPVTKTPNPPSTARIMGVGPLH